MEDVHQVLHNMTEFCKINEQFHIIFKLISSDKKLSDSDKAAVLLNYIAKEIIIIPQYFQSVLKHFPKDVPLLLAQATAFTDDFPFSSPRHIVNCILISKVCKCRPDLKSYALKYFEQYTAPFDEPQTGPTKSKKSRIALADNIYIGDLDIVEASYFLLKSDSTFFRHKWKWSVFVKKYSKHSDCKTQWLACQTIAIVMGLNEAALKSLILQRLPEELDRELTIEFDQNSTLINNSQETHSLDQHPLVPQKSIDLPEVVAISGIYVPAQNGPRSELLTEVPSTYNNLRKIALGLSSGKALCLQGAVGSGKTVLIEHMAAKTGRKLGESFIKVQLGDQTDSKMLLGTYRCSDTPGEFIWQPGVLTQAVMQGSWLVLEDIDLASMDIASVIASLLENKALTVPGYRDLVQIAPGFQLFMTQRLTITSSGQRQKRTSNALHLLEKQMLQITIDPLTSTELKHILHVLYPKFDTTSERLIKVFEIFCEQKNDGLSLRKHGRVISTRDFFKWCARAAIHFDVKSQDSAIKVLQNAIDVFCCSIPNYAEAVQLAKDICTHLGIINNKAEYYFDGYKPLVKLSTDRLISERVILIREHSIYSKPAKFCFTQPATILMERIMCCIKLKEPVLLVGETGTGKTSAVQYLAQILGKKLIVINMNQQSDSADLLGGFKPVDLKLIIAPIRREFESVFRDYFDTESNKEFLSKVAFAFNKQKYLHLVLMMKKSASAALARLSSLVKDSDDERKMKDEIFMQRWQTVSDKLYKVEAQIKHGNALYFAFIEGSLVKAVQEGSWVLLDEINLANAETLECLSGLLEDSKSSLCLLERGDKAPVKRHPNFTLFACMNPATNVGKKDLPTGLRNRFTEFYVDELTSKNDLVLLVNSYLDAMSLKESAVVRIVDFYLRIRKEMQLSLCDGIGHKPHFSLRSLCRALMIAAKNPCGTFSRSLYEAFCLSFLTQLDSASYAIVRELIESYLFPGEKKVKAVLKQGIPEPQEPGSTFLQFEGYWVKKGHFEPQTPDEYILTRSVRRNLKDLARVVSIGKLPVLLQGDTSVGKTSLITYLAKSSGNKCVRINNHEHTDLQEYIGSYVADASGKLVFREGVLVEAMREGHWIILDELNLAPSDVLEALNRVLDDNRELFIPETQETVKADPNFMLFATQNPPGVYGGRKMLSRAFRNRFVELHFNEIPSDELQFILHKRCEMPDSYAKKMISVMTDLQIRRRGSAAFAGKQGFITLRDLFRWGERYRLARQTPNLYDWNQHLVDEGYLVLAGKVRKQDERDEIITVLQKHWGRKVELNNLFSLHNNTSTVTKHILENIEKHKYPKIVWTFNMRKLAVLTAKALEFKEPVLLVGETGGGKTTVCQLIAEMNGQRLDSINCHMHTESSDFIGGLRPVRDHSKDSKSLFEWVDGPLLHAMSKGNVFLADEISLADDSVLERLNSLLEPERTLLLAEKGIDLNNPNNSEIIVAHPDFMFIGTMNPGGDFGKKELSPALRNRFTEIWCESCTDSDDLILIMNRNLTLPGDPLYNFGQKMMEFIDWFRNTELGKRYTISIRDVLTWVQFMNEFASDGSKIIAAYIYGAQLVFLDSLGSGVSSTESITFLTKFRNECQNFLNKQMDNRFNISAPSLGDIIRTESHFGVEPFSIQLGTEKSTREELSFEAPTTICNTFNVLKGMQLHKAILLEGSPGVGKTSLVIALAKASRHKIFRVNLSDQTDISDLFGADLPVEGGTGGQFSWRDGPLLQALKLGSWILLDELNLASQSVLEGLNACLDHRGEIFIPELGKTFTVQPGTRFFACQNPTKQGGSRRGLPKSFLNRFIQVYVSPFTPEDMMVILTNQFPIIPREMITKMIHFNYKLALSLDQHLIGNKGAPWECNLRDLTRWCQATIFHYESNQCAGKVLSPEYTAELIYVSRMRTPSDRQRVAEIFKNVMGRTLKGSKPVSYIAADQVYFGEARLKRAQDQLNDHVLNQGDDHLLLRAQSNVLRSLTYCVNQNWMAILVGNSGVGKSSVVKTLANLAGKTLKTLPVTSAMDTTDILGGFEQTNYSRHLEEIAKQVERLTLMTVQNLLLEEKDSKAAFLLEFWEEYLNLDSKTVTMDEEVQLFTRRIIKLESLLKELYMKCASSEEGNVMLELMNKCSAILSNVENDKSLSAGGRFEWVDSVLVKCLQEGSWLLVDNVNLCSAAVLDRLNGLLEPNGVLTVSEKGVDENGKMFIVKPHKDFRIFLTMDPKNGEISRAMRNRGVEIYMLNDSEVTCSNTFDIKSMIELQGLSDQKLIKALLKAHQFVSSIIQSEKPGVSELLQCSSLISQHLLHGIDTAEAFINACIEVYYKTRSLSEFNCNNVLELMRDGILRSLTVGDESELDFYGREVSLNTRNLNKWSVLEKVKQQLSIYLQSVVLSDNNIKKAQHMRQSTRFIPEFVSRTSGSSKELSIWNDIETVKIYNNEFFKTINFYTVANLLSISFSMSTLKDVDWKVEFNKKVQRHSNWLKFIDKFVTVTKIFGDRNSDLPFDHHWINTLRKNDNTDQFNFTLQIEIHILQDVFQIAHSPPNSFYNYLLSVEKNERPEQFSNPILSKYLKLRGKYFSFVKMLFRSFSNDMDGILLKLVELLSWRLSLHGFLTSTQVPENTHQAFESKMDMLALYYRWFYKYSVRAVAQLLKIDVTAGLQLILDDINEKMEVHFSAIHKTASNYKKLNNVPDFYTLESQLATLAALQKYDLFDRSNNPRKILAILKNNPELKQRLINLQTQTYSEGDLMDELSFLASFDKNEVESNLKLQELEVLPVVDILMQMSLMRMIKSIASGNFSDATSLNNNILLNADFNGVLLKFKETGDAKLLHEIKKCFYLAAANSPSARPDKFIDGTDNSEIGLSIAGVEPVFLTTIIKLLISLDDKSTTLGNFQDAEAQRQFLKIALWDNMHALSCDQFDFISSHVTILEENVNSFNSRLQKALNQHNQTEIQDSTLKSIISRLHAKHSELKQGHSKDIPISCIGDLHMNLSFAEMYLNSLLPAVDPLAKKAMKKNHLIYVLNMFEQMKTSFDLQNNVFSNDEECPHPYYAIIRERIRELEVKLTKYGDGVNAGVKKYTYSFVVQQIKYAFASIFKASILKDLDTCDGLILAIKGEGLRDTTVEKLQRHIEIFESSVPSFEKIVQDWKQYRGSYPDIVEPLLANVAQFLYGFKLKLFSLKREFVKVTYELLYKVDLEAELSKLVSLPTLNGNIAGLNDLVDCYTLQRTGAFVGVLCSEQPNYVKDEANVTLLMCEIQESFNQCLVSGHIGRGLNKGAFKKFVTLVDHFIHLWNKQQESKEKEKAEAESLYKTRTKCDDKTDEEQIEEDLNDLFPNYHVKDFADFEAKQLSDSLAEPVEKHQRAAYFITENDLRLIVDLHSKLFNNFTRTEWLVPQLNKNVRTDYVTPLMERYRLVRRLLESQQHYFQYHAEPKLYPSLAVLLDESSNYSNTNEIMVSEPSSPTRTKRTKNFYKDPDANEAKSCLPILDVLKAKVKELLTEWPDQPTLNSILVVIDRIRNFDIKSPLSRFLTGLDILLSKCYEWEQVAHSGVSLTSAIPELIAKIIEWRKIELSRWKELLDTTYTDLAKTYSNWWLYLYNLVRQYLSTDQVSSAELVDILQKFITRSPIVEFFGRVKLLLEFHCHVLILPSSAKSESLISILWNVYNYFNQFQNVISAKLKELRTPIDKKLKDFVKIVRWKDVNYWAVKDTVVKMHKGLHKFVREYKDLLLQPVTPYLINHSSDGLIESVGIWDRPQRQNPKAYHYTLDVDSYIIKGSIKNTPYLLKARKICKETILGANYPNLVTSLDSFVSDIIETSSHLGKLEIDQTLPKEKQKSQAKNILQQKHRALADLFQALSKIGVSYKTGIMEKKLKDPVEDFTVKPIDLCASFAFFTLNKSEEKMLTIWDSCELYYYRSLMRFDMLESALVTPAQDLGMQNVQRCQGFASHLLNLCQKQKTSLINATRSHHILRGYGKQLHEIADYSEFLTSATLLDIQNALSSTITIADQIQIILDACPVNESIDTYFIEVPLLDIKVDKFMRKHDEGWKKAHLILNDIKSLTNKVLHLIQRSTIDLGAYKYAPFNHKSQLFTELHNLTDCLNKLKTIFAPIKVIDCLSWLASSIEEIITKQEEDLTPLNHTEFEKSLSKLTKSLLLVMQNIYKKYQSCGVSSKTSSEVDAAEDMVLQENHLKALLAENLSLDIATLDLSKISKNAGKVVKTLLHGSAYAGEKMRTQISRMIPLYDQILQLSQYFITQQVAAYRTTCKLTSVLLNIFIDLASKGFCIPPEFSDELDKEGVSKPSDGMGLGEGEGERDASDKIESEDQLDDAQPAGKEKENTEDPDCEEAENGIEMSEDFDSKLQDKKPGDENEDDSQSDNSDAEDQMGETEKGADRLDKEIWGDDEEKDENDEGEENTEEDGTGGEKDGDNQLDAKDEEAKQKPQNKDTSPDQKNDSEEKQKEINELNEPEYDDEQVDPYHGNQAELPEPEPMDLPDDLQLDEGEEKEGEQPEENPFDIDQMKDQTVPEDNLEPPPSPKEQENDEAQGFSSDDEDITQNDEKDKTENSNDDAKNEEEQTGQDNAESATNPEEENADLDESGLDENPSNQENVEAMDVDDVTATDKTQATESENLKSNQPIEETCQEDKPDKEGVGQSQMEENQSGHSAQTNAPQDLRSTREEEKTEENRKEKPGQSDSHRSLGDVAEAVEKKLKALNATDDNTAEQEREERKAEMYQHIKDAKEEKSTQVLDAATKEQAKEQHKEITHKDDEVDDDESMEVEGASEVPENKEEEMEVDVTDTENQQPLKQDKNKNNSERSKQHPEGEILEEIENVDIEGDVVKTTTVERGVESSYHTQYHLLQQAAASKLTQDEINDIRVQVEQELSSWKSCPSSLEAEQTWQKISAVTSNLAQDLSEQLRLVLEPTKASHLKGDFRTGRRINMRKIIPYIASQFRKDKIWLRRTKPSKREYQIVLAIDDSSSMKDNHSKELAFESVALVSKALSLLESGQLAVVGFGKDVEIHHKLTDTFTDKSGIDLLQNFQFNQDKTHIGKLVHFVTEMFEQNNVQTVTTNAKLLLIVSDGRGVFSEGKTYVTQALRRAKLANVFTVFVIIDNPENQNSILDIRSVTFNEGKVRVENYMDEFPFSFYIILKDINSLPGVLSDALMQWFEMVTCE